MNNNLCDQTSDLIDSDRSVGETGELQTFPLIWSNEVDPRQGPCHNLKFSSNFLRFLIFTSEFFMKESNQFLLQNIIIVIRLCIPKLMDKKFNYF